MSDNLSEELKKVLGEVAEVAGFLWQRGWAERNAGNISVSLKDMPPIALLKDYKPFFIPLPESFPDMTGECFFVTATDRRMRDLARQPLRNAIILQITTDGSGFNIISHHGKTDLRPTSEIATHLGIHSMISRRKLSHRVVMHTHPAELVALTHIREACNEKNINKILLGMHPEVKVFMPEGAGFVPYLTPGTTEIGEATVKALEKHDVALWEKHGVFAIGRTPFETFDKVDLLTKSATVYLMCRAAGCEPEGLTDSQIEELSKIKF